MFSEEQLGAPFGPQKLRLLDHKRNEEFLE
jgi:hypothetical protein